MSLLLFPPLPLHLPDISSRGALETCSMFVFVICRYPLYCSSRHFLRSSTRISCIRWSISPFFCSVPLRRFRSYQRVENSFLEGMTCTARKLSCQYLAIFEPTCSVPATSITATKVADSASLIGLELLFFSWIPATTAD